MKKFAAMIITLFVVFFAQLIITQITNDTSFALSYNVNAKAKADTTKKTTYANGVVKTKTVTKYQANGKAATKTVTDYTKYGQVEKITVSTYDKKGKVSKKEVYSDYKSINAKETYTKVTTYIYKNGKVDSKTVTNIKPKKSAVASGVVSYTAAQQKEIRSEILKLMNNDRLKKGLSALKESSIAYSVAQVRAQEITCKFDHTRPNGKAWDTVYKQVDKSFNVDSYYLGENLVMNNKLLSPKEMASYLYTQWKNSAPHKANMMNSHFSKVGIAIVVSNGSIYATQEFIG